MNFIVDERVREALVKAKLPPVGEGTFEDQMLWLIERYKSITEAGRMDYMEVLKPYIKSDREPKVIQAVIHLTMLLDLDLMQHQRCNQPLTKAEVLQGVSNLMDALIQFGPVVYVNAEWKDIKKQLKEALRR